MKNILWLIIVIAFSNCIDRKESVSKKSTKEKDSVQSNVTLTKVSKSNTEIEHEHIDTLRKKSQPFKINGVNCYWELTLFLYKGQKGGTGKLELRNQKSSLIILRNDNGDEGDYYSLNGYGYWHSFNEINFELMNADIITDANFDGYEDFVIHNRSSSGSAGDFSDVYLFNPVKKTFERSKTLSCYDIHIDTTNKIVSSYAKNGAAYNVSASIHFGSHGKIKYSEVIETEKIDNNSPLFRVTNRKIINGKVVKTKIDTVTDY